MKKLIMTLMTAVFAITANAQYNVGTSSTTTDNFGNQTTTHRNQYGQTTGKSTSSTDYFGNTNSTYTDSYGRSTGTSTTSTGYFCIVDDCQFTSTWIPLRIHYALHVFS